MSPDASCDALNDFATCITGELRSTSAGPAAGCTCAGLSQIDGKPSVVRSIRMTNWYLEEARLDMVDGGLIMAQAVALEERKSHTRGHQSMRESVSSLPASHTGYNLNDMTCGVEVLLTSKEASQVLKIHPKVLERMAKRGEVPALKVGKFWRYRATALDAWINSRLQSGGQPCRMKTSF